MIINAVPAYREAPVSLDLLRENSMRFLELLASKNAAHNYLLIDGSCKDLIQSLEEQAKTLDGFHFTPVPVNGKSGFAFTNYKAAANAIKGETPLPEDSNPDLRVYSVEDILSPESKTLYVLQDSQKSKRISVGNHATASQILSEYGSGEAVKALFLGFPMGLMVSAADFDAPLELCTDYARVITENDCILHQLTEITGSFFQESCGQCVLGYEGLYQTHTILSDISNKKGKTGDLDLLRELSETMLTQCLCDIGKAAARLTMDTLKTFEAEISGHITKKGCRAAFCKKFVTYHILQNKCTGCTQCQDICGDDAIAGKKKFVHVIDQDECTQCGKCVDACENGAIVKAGAIKPKCPAKPVPCAK